MPAQNKFKMKVTKSKSAAGFTFTEIVIVVGIIGALLALVIPNFVRARTDSRQNACINNLRLIDSGKRLWGLENGATSTATPLLADIKPYMSRSSTAAAPTCPSSSSLAFSNSYVIGDMKTPPVCLINSVTHTLQ
jgi:type II secretory pathway pseudopilin PulG